MKYLEHNSMADMIDLNERANSLYVTRREYREDIIPIRDKLNSLSENYMLTVNLVQSMKENLEKVAKNTEVLTKSYGEWLVIKKFSAYAVTISSSIVLILFGADYSGLFRLISRYLIS